MKEKTNLEAIVSLIEKGEKPINKFMIGVEFEHIVVNKNTFESISYYGEDGIEGILQKLMLAGYKGKYEMEYLIGLVAEDREITLEPGGQLEISIKPCDTIEEVKIIYFKFLREIVPILEAKGYLLMSIGYHPKTSIEDLPFNPKKRYEHMSKYLNTKGTHAHNMMKGTAALQISIDYSNEEDFIRKFRVANFIGPLLYLISDNSPVFEGKIFNKFALRSLIWENTDKERSGIVPKSLSKDFGYRDYAEYILGIPPILITKDGEYIGTGNKKVAELMDEYDFSKEELEHIMTMVFPDARVKNYIEIRVGDSLPYPYNFAYITLIKGIFYNNIALQFLYNLSSRVTETEVDMSKVNMRDKGFDARLGSRTIYDCIRILFDLAKKSLSTEEKKMLMPLEKLMVNKTNLSVIAKEKLTNEGIESLKYSSQNRWVNGDEVDECKKII